LPWPTEESSINTGISYGIYPIKPHPYAYPITSLNTPSIWGLSSCILPRARCYLSRPGIESKWFNLSSQFCHFQQPSYLRLISVTKFRRNHF